MTGLIIVGILSVIAATGSGARFLIQALFVFPLMATFFGCAIWLGWNMLTGFSHIDMNSFTASALIGVVPALMVTSKF